jgi:hypothetical protein
MDSNPAKAIKICKTPSFGGGVKLETPCHKILQHVKEVYKYEYDYERNILYAKSVMSFVQILLICY